MAQPPEIARIAAELGDLARRAWARVQAALARLTGRQAQSRTLHREILATVGTEMGKLRQAVTRWARERLPAIFARGDRDAARRFGTTSAADDLLRHRAMERAMAREMVERMLLATRQTEESTKALLRRVAADEVLTALRREQSFQKIPTRMTEIMRGHGVHAVRYANGAKHSIDEYTEMLTRTIAARAYNTAILERGRTHGVLAVEVTDGAGCTWPVSHGQPPAANGLVVSVELAEKFVIAHPRCGRSFLLRTDIKDPAELADGELPAARPGREAEWSEHFHRLVRDELRAEVRREELARRRPSRLDARSSRLDARARRIAARLAARRAAEDIPDDLDVS